MTTIRTERGGRRTIIFDVSGRKLAELLHGYSSISWMINPEGQMPLRLSYTDPEVTRANIAIGNRIVVQFDDSWLPDWGGVIDTPFDQTATGVNATVYSAERLLLYRETSRNLSVAGPPGAIFRAIIRDINADAPTGIQIGTIDEVGDSVAKIYHHTNVFTAATQLANESGQEWAILPFLDDVGKLVFKAYWWEKRGVDRTTSVSLIEGMNAQFTLGLQDRIANQLRIAGQGSSWGTGRNIVQINDEASISLYDIRQMTLIDTSVPNDVAILNAFGNAILPTVSKPRSRLTASVKDQAPALFNQYGIGDSVNCHAFLGGGDEWGIIGKYRVRGRELLPDNTAILSLEEDI